MATQAIGIIVLTLDKRVNTHGSVKNGNLDGLKCRISTFGKEVQGKEVVGVEAKNAFRCKNMDLEEKEGI